MQHAVVGVHLPDGGAAPVRVTLAEDVVKVAFQKFDDSLSHAVTNRPTVVAYSSPSSP
ncbi:hypothetical protein ACTXG7_06660 [Mycolicibacterium sp. Dal123E01]|uniref:hypothetical protein n=1 Tax=Mycolicibacterium sp. Dal123E01 TaxID=3457578 RepID=UPI00403E9C7A